MLSRVLLQVPCRGRNEVPDPESVNTFVFEVLLCFVTLKKCLVSFCLVCGTLCSHLCVEAVIPYLTFLPFGSFQLRVIL